MKSDYNAQQAQQNSYAQFGRNLSLLLLGLVFSSTFALAQSWPSSTNIHETSYEVGDTVTLIVNLGVAGNAISNESTVQFRASYDASLLDPAGEISVDLSSSFFVCSGCANSTTVQIDEATSEIVVDVDLLGGSGSGHGELLRIHGTMVVEDYLKQARTNPEVAAADITVFPNPGQGDRTLLLPEDHLNVAMVYDQQGREVSRIDVAEDASEVGLPVSHLPAGIYWVRVPGADKAYSKQLVVK